MQRTGDTPAPVVTIGVDSIDETLKKVEAGGGSTVQPRTEIPDMGAFAYFKDSEGNVVGLWENFDHLTTGRPRVTARATAPRRISTRPSSSFDSRHAWISCG